MRKHTRIGAKHLLLAAAAPLAIIMATPALAQPTAPAGPAADEGSEVGELVVTGSLFRRTTTETASPVTVLSEQSLSDAGITTAAAAIRSVSADSAGSIAVGFQSGFSAGGSAVSLRGLGVSSTLLLVDGLRSTNFPINDDGHNAYVDLNSVPFSLIDRIEVLKDGASSLYGADAIGGVVNLILKKQFQGVAGSTELGQTYKQDGRHMQGDLTLGFGDYDTAGWNVYVNAEYQRDTRISHHSRGFPYNNRDLTSIGGIDNNSADNSLTTATPNAVVTRVSYQTALDPTLTNPFFGMVGSPLTTSYQLINPSSCTNGTFTQVSASANGVGCKHNIEDEYFYVQPWQEKLAYTGRLSVKLTDNIEGYATGTYSRSVVAINRQPAGIRQTQPYGASPLLASSNPGIVLPVYICASGVSCATSPARVLNPNNPFAAAFAATPDQGAARIYYTFGDVPTGSIRKNEVIRGAAGLTGKFMEWDWKVDAVGAKDNLLLTDKGTINIAGLVSAINTGAYNFVTPSANTQAVRDQVSPDVRTPSTSHMYSLDGSISRSLMMLPGGDLQLALGAQVRKEKLTNNTRNPRLDTLALTTSAAFGEHTVSAAYFEVEAPILEQVDLSFSGRYDDYSEGFSHFSPKVGIKYTPFKQLAFRGTWSEGFRAPTFAESGPRSAFAGFASFTPNAAFQLQHGGLTSGGNTNPYALAYNLGGGFAGNPALKPEISNAFTIGAIAQPLKWLSMTVDYYHIKKDGLIVAGPDLGAAKAAYYTGTTAATGCAAVAAIGAGYSCNTLDAVDPLFPLAMPRVLIINAPFVNANYFISEGVDFSATGKFNLPYDALLTSKIEITKTLSADLHTPTGIQKYAGTLGPYELSSGNGTPDLRANWQNTISMGRFRVAATTYFVDKIKEVATDEGSLSTDCQVAALYGSTPAMKDQFCYVKRFFNTDLHGSVEVKKGLSLYADIGNVFNAKAPIAPAAYSSAPNYLITWHSAGVIGRTYKVGASFDF
ncbi:hypothetical protein BH11PSE2_BH11PSE2_08560 [soil metagenome]